MSRYLVLVLLLGGVAAHADVPIDEVRRLIQQGEVRPLQEVIAHLQRERSGHLLEAELERKSGRYLYELEWLDADGTVWELIIDAHSGQLLREKQDD